MEKTQRRSLVLRFSRRLYDASLKDFQSVITEWQTICDETAYIRLPQVDKRKLETFYECLLPMATGGASSDKKKKSAREQADALARRLVTLPKTYNPLDRSSNEQ